MGDVVFSGCICASSPGMVTSEGAAELAAIQHASSVVVASRIDLFKPLNVKGSYGLEKAHATLEGVETDLGAVYMENSTRAPMLDQDLRTSRLITHTCDELDVSECSLQPTIFTTGGSSLKLLTFLAAGIFRRVLNPAQALCRLLAAQIPRVSMGSPTTGNLRRNQGSGRSTRLLGIGPDTTSRMN